MANNRISRRAMIALLGGATLARPNVAHAQQARPMRRVGVLMSLAEGDTESPSRVVAFEQKLQALGWRDGANVQFDIRWAGGDPNRARPYAKQLVALNPDAIVAVSNINATAILQANRTIPVIFVAVGDPIGSHFVASWGHPGGVMTGIANFWPSMGGKWLEMLTQIAPRVKRIGYVENPETMSTAYSEVIEAAAPALAVHVTKLEVRTASKIEPLMHSFAREPNGGLVVPPDPFMIRNRTRIIELAARYRLPAIYPYGYFAKDGGMLSYGFDVVGEYVQAAAYVDSILRGARPADLAVQYPEKTELVINLTTVRTLGLKVPRTLLIRADRVIE